MSDAVAEPVPDLFLTESEPVPSPILTPINPVRRDHLTRISPETARLMHQKRREKKELRARLGSGPDSKPQQNPDQEPDKPKPDPYLETQLVRARKELDRLFSMITGEEDPAKIDRLASAISRLSEIERQLADRPLPGSKRPGVDKSSSGRASYLLGTSPEPTKGAVEQE